MHHKLRKVNVFGETQYRCQTLSNISVISDGNKLHITMSGKIPDWDEGFDSSEKIEKFINDHEIESATLSEIVPTELTEVFNFLKVFYGFAVEDEDMIKKEIDGSIISVLKTDEGITVTCDNQSEIFTDASELVSFFDNLMRSFHFEVLSSEDIEYAMSGRSIVLASISSRELTKNLVRVRSSNVWAYCINIKNRKDKTGDVLVQFKGPKGGPGDIYIYYSVPINIWRKIIGSPSAGHAVWQYLRGRYTYAKLTGDKKTKMRGGIN